MAISFLTLHQEIKSTGSEDPVFKKIPDIKNEAVFNAYIQSAIALNKKAICEMIIVLVMDLPKSLNVDRDGISAAICSRFPELSKTATPVQAQPPTPVQPIAPVEVKINTPVAPEAPPPAPVVTPAQTPAVDMVDDSKIKRIEAVLVEYTGPMAHMMISMNDSKRSQGMANYLAGLTSSMSPVVKKKFMDALDQKRII